MDGSVGSFQGQSAVTLSDGAVEVFVDTAGDGHRTVAEDFSIAG